METFKLVLADPKTGKCYQREIKDAEAEVFLGKQIGDKIKGDSFGLNGYEFEITGGSDSSGFPMRNDLKGVARRKILIVSGVGAKRKRKGQRQRKSVSGNTIGQNTSQINLKTLKYGKVKLESSAPATEKPTEKQEEKPEEKTTEESKKEEKEPEEKIKESPKEEKPEEKKKS